MNEHCPICDAPGKQVRENREVKFGRRCAEVEHEFYRCPECGEQWYTGDQMDQAQRLAAQEIRTAEGLLAPGAIRGIREALGLSQADFERLLGFGPKTVGRWERGTVIPNASSDLLIRAVGSLPDVVRFLALKTGVALPERMAVNTAHEGEWRPEVRERLAAYQARETPAPAEDTMTQTVSLQMTYQQGRPLAAYLYLASNGKRDVARSEEAGADLVVDYSPEGAPVGIEILSPSGTSLEDVWRLCDRLGIERPSADDLRPLSAA